MNWTAVTSATTLKKKHAIHFTEQTSAAVGPSSISAGDTFSLEYPDNSRAKGVVMSASNQIIEVDIAGERFNMRPHQPSDYPVSIVSPGLHFQNWVII